MRSARPTRSRCLRRELATQDGQLAISYVSRSLPANPSPSNKTPCKNHNMGRRKLPKVDLSTISLTLVVLQVSLGVGQVIAWDRIPTSHNFRMRTGSDQRYWSPSSSAQDTSDESQLVLPQASGDSIPLLSATTSATGSTAFDHRRGTSLTSSDLATNDDLGDASLVSAGSSSNSEDEASSLEPEDSADSSQETPERNMFLDRHKSQLQAMHDLFERRQLNNPHQIQSSQELNPISIGLDPVQGAAGPSPFLPPFQVPNRDVPALSSLSKPPISNADNLDQGLGPSLPFGLNPLPHLLGFQNQPFDGPQRGDQSAHSNQHAALPSNVDSEQTGPGQKVWPKIFRFTDGRINLAEFEKQKKIRLSNKNQHNSDNHIESAPVIFDGRQLKRKSFLILHGGIFSK